MWLKRLTQLKPHNGPDARGGADQLQPCATKTASAKKLQPPRCTRGRAEPCRGEKEAARAHARWLSSACVGAAAALVLAMPRDNMASRIQRVARQARRTFRAPSTDGAGNGTGPRSGEELQRLRQLLGEVRAEDLRLAPRGPTGSPGQAQPPASYMHICQTESFSMGVFVLRDGARIPLHNHPGMNGLLKVLYGTLRIACLDAPLDGDAGAAGSASSDPGAAPQPGSAAPPRQHRTLLRSHQLYTPASPPCVLSPHTDNLHQIDAVDGPAAFLDILAPPYDPEHGRDCHYYRLLDGHGLHLDPRGLPKEVWVLETSPPPDFRCGSEPYPGPRVSP